MKDSTRDVYTPTDPAAQAIALRRAAEQLEVAERNCAPGVLAFREEHARLEALAFGAPLMKNTGTRIR